MTPIRRLAEVAAEAEELWCLCYLDIGAGPKTAQIVLRSKKNGTRLEVDIVRLVDGAWRNAPAEGSTLVEGLLLLAMRWRGTLVSESIETGAKKSPVRGKALDALFLAALHEAFSDAIPRDVLSAYNRLSLGGEVIKTAPRQKVPKPAGPVPPASLLAEVDGEPAILARRRAAAAKDWSFTKTSAFDDRVEVLAALLALDRCNEAADVARAIVEAMPARIAGTDYYFWMCSVHAAAVLAYLDPKEQARFEALFRSGGYEKTDADQVSQEIRDFPVVAFNTRYHPEETQRYALDLLSATVLRAVTRERLTGLVPYSAWYSKSAIVSARKGLLDALRARLVGEKRERAPAGYVPIAYGHFDRRFTLGFASDGTARAAVRTIVCPSCTAHVSTARCVTCESWFVTEKPQAAFACDSHARISGHSVDSHIKDGVKQRQCRRCGAVAIPFEYDDESISVFSKN